MAQEFTIKSDAIENKINQLLPSQGGFGAGVDLSASSMVIPVVDLTESATGSGLRQDLQTAVDYSVTTGSVASSSNTAINPGTGFWRLYGQVMLGNNTSADAGSIDITDGTTAKEVFRFVCLGESSLSCFSYDKILFLRAGDSLVIRSNISQCQISYSYRQIADVTGNLVSPNNFSVI
jgi:hypothetical protein